MLCVDVCCCLLAVYVLVPVLVVNCFVDDGLTLSGPGGGAESAPHKVFPP